MLYVSKKSVHVNGFMQEMYTPHLYTCMCLFWALQFSERKWQRTPVSGVSCSCSTEAQAGLCLSFTKPTQLISSPTTVALTM